jgi:hypothetical protein
MPDTRVDLDFADGRYSFWLALPHVIELERKAGGKSIFRMYDEMGAGLGLNGDEPVYLGGGDAKATDIREVIRLGLQGGNAGTVDGADIEVGPRRANELVEAYTFPNRPLIEGLHVAWSILHAAIVGIDLKKKAPDAGDIENPSPSEKDS